MTFAIDRPRREDRAAWERLYHGYAEFYRVPMTPEILSTLWGWLHDPAHEVEGLLARDHGRPIGLAHFRPFARPLRGATGLFLDDLFVDPERRDAGVGRRLIEAVGAEARRRDLGLVRWITAEDNARARALYDRMATATRWVTYDMDVTG